MKQAPIKHWLVGLIAGIVAVAALVALRLFGVSLVSSLTVVACGAFLVYALRHVPKPYRRHSWGQAQQAVDQSMGIFGQSYPEELIEPARGGKVGRNEPCPCGSGRKYKRCCGRAAAG